MDVTTIDARAGAPVSSRRAPAGTRPATSSPSVQRDTAMPSAPPSTASATLSSTTCRTIAPRPAPSAIRVANSPPARDDAGEEEAADADARHHEDQAGDAGQDQQRRALRGARRRQALASGDQMVPSLCGRPGVAPVEEHGDFILRPRHRRAGRQAGP